MSVCSAGTSPVFRGTRAATAVILLFIYQCDELRSSKLAGCALRRTFTREGVIWMMMDTIQVTLLGHDSSVAVCTGYIELIDREQNVQMHFPTGCTIYSTL